MGIKEIYILVRTRNFNTPAESDYQYFVYHYASVQILPMSIFYFYLFIIGKLSTSYIVRSTATHSSQVQIRGLVSTIENNVSAESQGLSDFKLREISSYEFNRNLLNLL